MGQEDPLEEGMATHSSILAWRIPWTEEPGNLQSRGSKKVRHNWSDLASMHVWFNLQHQPIFIITFGQFADYTNLFHFRQIMLRDWNIFANN